MNLRCFNPQFFIASKFSDTRFDPIGPRATVTTVIWGS